MQVIQGPEFGLDVLALSAITAIMVLCGFRILLYLWIPRTGRDTLEILAQIHAVCDLLGIKNGLTTKQIIARIR